jgi:ABC-type lipoprotein release transport system permease subunit
LSLLYLMKELIRRKGRTATNILAVAVLVSIFVILASVMNAFSEAVYLPFKSMSIDMIIQKASSQASATAPNDIRLPFGKSVFYQKEIDDIANLEPVKDISKSLLLWCFDKGKFISVEGLEPDSYIGKTYSSWITSGHFLNTYEKNKAVVEKHFAKFYGLKPGDDLKLSNNTFEIIGIIASEGESQVSATNVYISLASAQEISGINGYSQVYVKLDNISSDDIIRSEIGSIDSNAVIVSASSIATSLSNVVRIYHQFYLLMLAIIAIILAVILFQINTNSLMERRRDIGVLQSIGWTRANISRQLISEIFIQAISGFFLGIIISLLTITAIGSISVQTNTIQGLDNSLSSLTAPLTISGFAVWQFFVLTLVVSIAISFFLVRKLAGMKPMANLKDI